MSLRLFAALPLPDDVADLLVSLQRGVPLAKWRPRDTLHLTLRFFGEVAEPIAEEIDAALEQVAMGAHPFEVKLKAAGSFGGGDPHTLWVGADGGEALKKLAADCERAARRLGLKPETRNFTPHVTLAYLGGGTELARVHAFETQLGLFETPSWRVASFALYSSWLRRSGPSLYRQESEYAL